MHLHACVCHRVCMRLNDTHESAYAKRSRYSNSAAVLRCCRRVIAGQATQIYWALQCRAFPLNLMTAKTGMRADGSVTVQRGWNIHRVGQSCALLGVPFFLSFFFFFFITQSTDREHSDTNLCLTLKKRSSTHCQTIRDSKLCSWKQKEEVIHHSLYKHSYITLFLYLDMCKQTQTQANSTKGALSCFREKTETIKS